MPDIGYAVGVISQFMDDPTLAHMEVVYRVLKYLKGCLGKGIMYKKIDHQRIAVAVYSDAYWAGSLTDRKSTSGYYSFV